MIKNNKGVTLVELLIVIVILGIIAAISIPAVGNIVENSQKDAVIADATNIRNAANLCITSGDCPDGTYGTTGTLTNPLASYLTGFGDEFMVVISGGAVTGVAIEVVDTYWYSGDPLTGTRANVLTTQPAAWDTTFDDGSALPAVTTP
jgi:type IV pilus assembly protein PilA